MDTSTLLVAALICGIIGLAVGSFTKGRPAAGLVWGFLLGPIGWLIVALGPSVIDEKAKAKAERDEKMRRARDLARQPQQQAASGSVADEIAKLSALRVSGALTPEEFDRAKAKLLGAG